VNKPDRKALALPQPVVFNPLSVVSTDDPWSVYHRLRADSPLHYSPEADVWTLSRFADVQTAARDWRTFSSAPSVDLDQTGSTFGVASIFDVDPPQHDRLRRPLQSSFSPRAIADLEEFVRSVAGQLLEPLLTGEEVDFVESFAWRLPLVVARAQLGIDAEDEDAFGSLLHALLSRNHGQRTIPSEALEAGRSLLAFFEDRLGSWRDSSHTGSIVPSLIEALDRNVLSREEVVSLATMLGAGFTETTSGLLASMCRLFAEHPDQTARLRREPQSLVPAIEEILRFEPPAHFLARTVNAPVALHGERLDPGARVVLLFASANRDERRWESPDTLDLFRPLQRNLAFGEGIHHCLGAPLARLEARIAGELLLRSTADIEIIGNEGRWYPTHGTRGFSELRVRLSPSHAQASAKTVAT
jgi:cytochrome P450